jgi:hypothetical protein
VHFSGGEPTLWRQAKLGLADLLLEIAKAGFTPGFTSNGSHFLDYRRCYDFFAKYANDATMPLRLYLSIDRLHRNFDRETGRAQCLDNVVRCRQELPPAGADLIDIKVLVVISKDSRSLLPNEMVAHYESLGVTFVFVPLQPRGKGKLLRHLCPDLNSDDAEDLGAYRRFHLQRQRPPKTENMDRADNLILIGDQYYFDHPFRKVARLGRLPDAIMLAYGAIPKDSA